jgi:zinc transporter ZupT
MLHQLNSLKILAGIIIFIVTLSSGIYPFFKKIKTNHAAPFPFGEALASGIFLGAGLLHMLNDATQQFVKYGYDYPFTFLLAGSMFLILLLFEHITREIYQNTQTATSAFAILATLMLAMHSFLAGAALGVSDSLSFILIILVAILGHKWAASFALAIQINKSQLSTRFALILFISFALMTPLGILVGSTVTAQLHKYPLIEPILIALAAGTFLYLGTLHGLKESILVERCCNLNQFTLVITGFIIMALVAIWV